MDWSVLGWIAIWYAKEGRHYNVVLWCAAKAVFGRLLSRKEGRKSGSVN